MAHPVGESAQQEPVESDKSYTRTEEQRIVERVLPQSGMSFRGGFGQLERTAYEVGKTYRHAGVLYSSRDPRVATDNFADEDIVVLFGSEGRDLGRASNDVEDAETAYSPDPSFTVVAQTQIEARQDARIGGDYINQLTSRRSDQRADERVADEPWLTVVVVHGERHDDPPTDAQDAIQRAVHAIAGARQLGPADLTEPGRYRGPFGTGADGRLQSV